MDYCAMKHGIVRFHFPIIVEPQTLRISGQPPYNGQTVHPLPIYIPLNSGQNTRPQCVHYSEVPLYTIALTWSTRLYVADTNAALRLREMLATDIVSDTFWTLCERFSDAECNRN